MKLSKAQLKALDAVESAENIGIKMYHVDMLMNHATKKVLLSRGLVSRVSLGIGMPGLILTAEGRKALEEARNGN